MNIKPKLLDQVRAKIRLKHYSICTEQTYVDWIRRYILINGKCLAISCCISLSKRRPSSCKCGSGINDGRIGTDR